MSYEIARSLSIKKNGDIVVTCTSNNVRPYDWHTLTAYNLNRDGLFNLFLDLIQGNLKLQSTCSKKVRYAFMKVRDFVKENNIDTYKLYQTPTKIIYEKLAKEAGIEYTYLFDDDPNHDYNKQHEMYLKLKEKFGDERFSAEYPDAVEQAYAETYAIFLEGFNNYKPDKNKYVIRLTQGSWLYSLSKLHYRWVYQKEKAKTYDLMSAKEVLRSVYYSVSKDATIEQI